MQIATEDVSERATRDDEMLASFPEAKTLDPAQLVFGERVLEAL